MARRKGIKIWDEITPRGWLALMGDTGIMTDLMVKIFISLYHSPHHTNNAKTLAQALHMEYRALNAAAGWAGTKVKELYTGGKIEVKPKRKRRNKKGKGSRLAETSLISSRLTPFPAEEEKEPERAPWEYIFDGVENEDGTYFWVMKPEMAAAIREWEETDLTGAGPLLSILAEDDSSFPKEKNLFAVSPEKTVERIRKWLRMEFRFQRRSLKSPARCTVCGLSRVSLLRAVPYGLSAARPGLLFCPTHAALFQAHLISYSDSGKLLVSPALSAEERKLLGLVPGDEAKNDFSRRRMAAHRKYFNEESRKDK